MKPLVYFNDRKTPARIYIEDFLSEVTIVNPAEYATLDIQQDEDELLFIKVWENNNVLIKLIKKHLLK